MLLLGVVCKPVLGFVGELHAVEHAILAVDGDGHGLPDAGVDDHDAGGDGDEGHTFGVHGLLHQAGGFASSLPAADSLLVPALAPAEVLPRLDAFSPARSTLTLPFRPPIA